MNILVVHQYYLMPGQAGGSRFNEFARLWSEAGHEIAVIAGTVDHGSGESPRRYHGKIWTEERDGAVRVFRCHVPRSYGRGYLGRMWGFLGFTLSSSLVLPWLKKADVVIATSPPLTTAIPGWLAAQIVHGAPWIFEVRDLWPESAVTTGVLSATSPITHGLYLLERFAYRRCDRINVLTPAFRDNILGRRLSPRDKIVFVPNGADLETFRPGLFDPELRLELGWGDRFVVMYAGAHGRANALGQLVEAADRLRTRPDILIACVGDGPLRKKWQAEAKQRGLKNIVFHGPRPKADMPRFTCTADAGAAVLQNNPSFKAVYPNKVFDYMACERPTLLAIDGVARELVCDDAQAGVFAPPEDADALAAAIKELADDGATRAQMGQRGRAWVSTHMGRERLAARYLEIMEELKRQNRGRSFFRSTSP